MKIWIGCGLLVWGVSTFDSNGIAFVISVASTLLGLLILAKVNKEGFNG